MFYKPPAVLNIFYHMILFTSSFLKSYICLHGLCIEIAMGNTQGTKRTPNFKKPVIHFKQLFSKNKWENDDSDMVQALYSVYNKNMTALFPYLLVNLFKQKYISSAKSYKYLNKFIG